MTANALPINGTGPASYLTIAAAGGPAGPTGPTGSAGSGGISELAYAQITGNFSVTTAMNSEAAAGVVVTAPSVTFAGTPITIEFYAPLLTGASVLILTLHDDTAGISLGYLAQTGGSSTNDFPTHAVRRITPSAGARVYSVRAWESGGAGTVFAGNGTAANYAPAFIRITG
jgi:hypothetical protein